MSSFASELAVLRNTDDLPHLEGLPHHQHGEGGPAGEGFAALTIPRPVIVLLPHVARPEINNYLSFCEWRRETNLAYCFRTLLTTFSLRMEYTSSASFW